MKKKIKLFDPVVGNEEEITLKKILRSGFWASGAGTGKVSEFEKKFSKYTGSKFCVAVGTFLYLAASDFVPEIRKEEGVARSVQIFVIFGAGVIFMWLLTLLEL